MRGRSYCLAALVMAAVVVCCGVAFSSDLAVVERSPEALVVRLSRPEPNTRYRVTYQEGKHSFVWDNLVPDSSGAVRLADDRHLRPEYRLRCESRISRSDPVVFDDLLKGPVVGKRRQPHGVPVSTFGAPGYLVPGISDLQRDDFGNLWLYLDHQPYAILKYNPACEYQFALLTPGRILAHDLDADGNLYLLHPGNWISKHGPMGDSLGAWELAVGRGPGEVISASGLAVDRRGGFMYLADEALGRVQRFDLNLGLRPMAQIAWGWIGREDLAFTGPGRYDADTMYYQLDRPRQLRLDGRGHLFVSCEHYISEFDLASGRQEPFGANPVLGWGGTFSDSPFSPSAGLDGHWQRHWLAGVDGAGRIYVADRENEFVVNPRLQVFSSDGALLNTLDIEDDLRDQAGRRVYITAVAGLASAGEGLWLVDAAGRVYWSQAKAGFGSGGRLWLGPGAAGRQFDLSRAEEGKFRVEAQTERSPHRVEGLVLGFSGDRGTGNCEREGRPELANGERSLWLLTRLGEPFRVTLFDLEGKQIPASQYTIELEEKPGLFGSLYDFFRVTNHSGAVWRSVRFAAEATG